ncbi:MAG: hypothetical protein FWD31_13495 [Planctomycetaceae bacterium]|nr:hypothetical protein [Planctomycetaceae bacterium]
MIHKRFSFLLLLLLACCLFSFVGCSDKVKVKGKVTLTDGTPVGCGQVVFETSTFSASGEIKQDGTYVMGSLKANDGLPKGEYIVYIRGATQTGKQVEFQTLGGDGRMTTMSIPSLTSVVALEYTSASTSPLKCPVQKSMTFDIEVPPSGL